MSWRRHRPASSGNPECVLCGYDDWPCDAALLSDAVRKFLTAYDTDGGAGFEEVDGMREALLIVDTGAPLIVDTFHTILD